MKSQKLRILHKRSRNEDWACEEMKEVFRRLLEAYSTYIAGVDGRPEEFYIPNLCLLSSKIHIDKLEGKSLHTIWNVLHQYVLSNLAALARMKLPSKEVIATTSKGDLYTIKVEILDKEDEYVNYVINMLSRRMVGPTYVINEGEGKITILARDVGPWEAGIRAAQVSINFKKGNVKGVIAGRTDILNEESLRSMGMVGKVRQSDIFVEFDGFAHQIEKSIDGIFTLLFGKQKEEKVMQRKIKLRKTTKFYLRFLKSLKKLALNSKGDVK
jgi:hypothetical protein